MVKKLHLPIENFQILPYNLTTDNSLQKSTTAKLMKVSCSAFLSIS